MDGALYGPLLPVLKTFGDRNIMDVVNSVAISLQKFFGMPIPGGVVLTNEAFDKQVFDDECEMIEYVSMYDRLTITGTRSGHKALLAYKIFQTLEMDKGP